MFARMKLLQKYLLSHVPLINRSMHLLKDKAYINGKWIQASSKETFPVCNPFNNTVITHVPDMNTCDTRIAIDAAAEAFNSYSKFTAKERSNLLKNWYILMSEYQEDLAQILTKENGKSLIESRAEIIYGNSFVEWYAEEARRINGEILQAPVKNREMFLIRQPIGVTALITPWNLPYAMITRKAGAALAAGCTCIVKPSEDTPLTALALADLAEQAGFPAGIFNVISASKTNSIEVGKELCENSHIRVVSFTGSTTVGKILYKQSASTMKKLCLELGGNAPYIVFESANIDLAVKHAMASKFRNCGQTCVSANRFFVETDVFDEFVEKFVTRIECDIKLGDGSKEGITHGPLTNQNQLDIVNDLVQDAVQKGAKVHCGATPLTELGPLFYAPTLLTDVTENMKIYNTEIFGPVAVINKFENEEDVIRRANDTPVGLAGYFFSQDISQIHRVARNLEVGMIGINEGSISSVEAAFGGIKESGIGREGSHHGIDHFVEIKYICIST